MILPWNRCSTESGIESQSSGMSKKLPNTESNEPLFGAWQTGHSLELTKQLWQEKCPQLVNEPGTISPPGPQTRCSHIWGKSETNRFPVTQKNGRRHSWHQYEGIISDWFLDFELSWVLMAWFQISSRRPNDYSLRLLAWLSTLEYLRALATTNFVASSTIHCLGSVMSFQRIDRRHARSSTTLGVARARSSPALLEGGNYFFWISQWDYWDTTHPVLNRFYNLNTPNVECTYRTTKHTSDWMKKVVP